MPAARKTIAQPSIDTNVLESRTTRNENDIQNHASRLSLLEQLMAAQGERLNGINNKLAEIGVGITTLTNLANARDSDKYKNLAGFVVSTIVVVLAVAAEHIFFK